MAYSFRSVGPDGKHPITGVLLNTYRKRRKSLTFEDAVTIWIMRLQCENRTDIEFFMGTCGFRIHEVLAGEVHADARAEALRRLTR